MAVRTNERAEVELDDPQRGVRLAPPYLLLGLPPFARPNHYAGSGASEGAGVSRPSPPLAPVTRPYSQLSGNVA